MVAGELAETHCNYSHVPIFLSEKSTLSMIQRFIINNNIHLINNRSHIKKD